MNQLTLQFQDKHIAELYANHPEWQKLKFITHFVVSLTAVVIRFVDLTSNLDLIDNIGQIGYTISVIILIHSFLSALIILKYRQYADQALFILNIVIAFNELEIGNKDYDRYKAYLLGSTQMIGHVSIFIVLSFRAGILNTFILSGIRIGITNFKSSIVIQEYIFIISVSIFFTVLLYFLEKLKRSQFLLTIKDNSMEMILKHFIRKPFYLFQYNKKKQQVEIIIQKGELEFQQLLDLVWNQKNTLREYIYSKIDQFEKTNVIFEDEEYLKIKVNNQKEIIKFQYFQFYYMISIDSQDDFHTHIKQINQQNFNNLLNYFINILQKCTKLLQQNDKQLIIQLKFTLHQLINFIIPRTFSKLSLYSQKYDNQYTYDVQTINLTKTIIKIINSINTKSNIKIQFEGCADIKIKSPKGLLNIFILELLKNAITQKKTIKMSLYKNQYNILEISGFMNLPTNKLYLTLANVFILNSTQTSNCRLIIFNNEPDLSFLNIPIL